MNAANTVSAPHRKLRVLQTIDAHNAGELIRVAFIPYIPGATMQEKKRYLERKLDWIRRTLMLEPIGHRDAYGVVITAPTVKEAHFGAVYMDTAGWHDMCGHATMGFASIAVQLGLIEARSPVTEVVFDTPVGIVKAYVHVDDEGAVKRDTLINVPSFYYDTFHVAVPGLGEVPVHVAFGVTSTLS